MQHNLTRATFKTNRTLDFCSRKELIAQTGHGPESWPLVAIKELIDNGMDACEDENIAPVINITVDQDAITVSDNGPGIFPATVVDVLDFEHRVSSREAYVSPTRGAQGNALKTIVAMPCVLGGEQGRVEIASCGIRHKICLKVDRVRQVPIVGHQPVVDQFVRNGTFVRIYWPNSARSILECANARFLQLVHDYSFLNPHLSLSWNWFGEAGEIAATNPEWKKWRPNNPTCVHWYSLEKFERLIAGYLAYCAFRNQDRTVREFIAEFSGFAGSANQRQVLDETGLARAPLSKLANDSGMDRALISALLASMKRNSRLIKPAALGVIGPAHLKERFGAIGCEMDLFTYKREICLKDGVPSVLEVAFAWAPELDTRRLITGVNWSPAIPGTNPFRKLDKESLDSILESARAGKDESVVLFVSLAVPGAEYTDRGKSALVIDASNESISPR